MPCGVSVRVMSRGAEIAWRGNLGLACWLVGLSVFVFMLGENLLSSTPNHQRRDPSVSNSSEMSSKWDGWLGLQLFVFAEAMRRGLAECVSANLHEALGT